MPRRFNGGIITKTSYAPTSSSASGIWTLDQAMLYNKDGKWPGQGLYAFTTATFGTGGVTGFNGPNITQARLALGNPTWASTYLNMTTNGIQLWTVPRTAIYRIRAVGASAGSNTYAGGRGIIIQADVSLVQGDVLKILVGQGGVCSPSSDQCNTGAGGGTFVTYSNNTPIIVAGGGGGLGGPSGVGLDAVASTTGGSSSSGTAGGTDGSGGGANQGASGAGLTGNGTQPQWGLLGGTNNGIAQAFTASAAGQGGTSTQATVNRNGGFGGGGAGHGNCYIGGPGGGGYSGGGAAASGQKGGGGGSFIISTATNVQTSTGQYNGSSTFNGSAITNLAQYNTAVAYTAGFGTAGQLQITAL